MTSPGKLIQDNLYEFYDRLAEAAGLDFERNDQWSAVKNEPGFWPGVIYRITPGLISVNSPATFPGKITSGELPGFLISGDESIEQISPFLQEQGFFPFAAWKGMILDKFEGNQFETPEPVTVEKVTGGADLEKWMEIVSEGLLRPAQVQKSFFQKLLAHPSFELFLLKCQGIGVSTVMVFKTADSVGLYLIVTAKPAQQKGYGTTLIKTVLAGIATESGKPVVLQSAPAGELLYRKLGFVPVNRFFLFRCNKSKS